MSRLKNKVAVITGGTSGMGLATARRFVEEGAFVYITGRRQTELDKAVSLIGRSVAAVQGDVSNLADLDRLYAKVASEKGKIDILFAGAGIVDPQLLAETTEESFDKVFAINTCGLAFTVKKALPLLNDGGAIIGADRIDADAAVLQLDRPGADEGADCRLGGAVGGEAGDALVLGDRCDHQVRSIRRSSTSRRRPRKGPTRPAPSSPRPSRSGGSAARRRSRQPPCSSRLTKQASSQAWTSRSMAA
jgi:NAD(P)-dependent dehydrogenase (short-subunit alcohol dehydrogenase family)